MTQIDREPMIIVDMFVGITLVIRDYAHYFRWDRLHDLADCILMYLWTAKTPRCGNDWEYLERGLQELIDREDSEVYFLRDDSLVHQLAASSRDVCHELAGLIRVKKIKQQDCFEMYYDAWQ